MINSAIVICTPPETCLFRTVHSFLDEAHLNLARDFLQQGIAAIDNNEQDKFAQQVAQVNMGFSATESTGLIPRKLGQ